MLMGGVHARYADSLSGTAALTTLQLSGSTNHSAGTVTGSLSKFSSGEWITQLSGFGAAVAPLGSGVSLGVSAAGDANRIQGGTWNGQASAGLLGVLSVNRTLVTVGASIGTARTVYDSTLAMNVLSARVGHTVGNGAVLSGGVVALRSDTVEYADASVEFGYTSGKTRVSVSAGVRAGDLADDPWGQAHVEYDLLPQLTYELTLGRYPQSLVGFTDGLFVTTGIRVRLPGRSAHRGSAERPVDMNRIDENRFRVTLAYSGDAETLEIVGEWNGWLPLSLEREANSRWSAELVLEPGIYQYAIVVNGDIWTVPDGVVGEADDFGGEMATLVVIEGGR